MELLKQLLTDTPVLAFPDFSERFILDASGMGLGKVLSQKKDGVTRPLSYASRTRQPHQKNHSATELEALGVVWAVKHYRPYLYGNQCDVFTDHVALKSLLNTPQPSGKFARWGLALQDLELTIHYQAGKQNTNADVLSRYPVEAVTLPSVQRTMSPGDVHVVGLTNAEPLEKENGDVSTSNVNTHIWLKSEDGILPTDEKVKDLLPIELQSGGEVHGGRCGGHLREAKIHGSLNHHYWWPGMRMDIVKWCRECIVCASRRVGKGIKPPLTPIPVSDPVLSRKSICCCLCRLLNQMARSFSSTQSVCFNDCQVTCGTDRE